MCDIFSVCSARDIFSVNQPARRARLRRVPQAGGNKQGVQDPLSETYTVNLPAGYRTSNINKML